MSKCKTHRKHTLDQGLLTPTLKKHTNHNETLGSALAAAWDQCSSCQVIYQGKAREDKDLAYAGGITWIETVNAARHLIMPQLPPLTEVRQVFAGTWHHLRPLTQDFLTDCEFYKGFPVGPDIYNPNARMSIWDDALDGLVGTMVAKNSGLFG